MPLAGIGCAPIVINPAKSGFCLQGLGEFGNGLVKLALVDKLNPPIVNWSSVCPYL